MFHLFCRTCRELRHLKPPRMVRNRQASPQMSWEALLVRTKQYGRESYRMSQPPRPPALSFSRDISMPKVNTQRNESTR